MKGFELKFKDSETDNCLYITNLPKSGSITIMIAEDAPSSLDVTHPMHRTDVPINTFGAYLGRVQKKMVEWDADPIPDRFSVETPERFREVERR